LWLSSRLNKAREEIAITNLVPKPLGIEKPHKRCHRQP
jgi:hypothetical protein